MDSFWTLIEQIAPAIYIFGAGAVVLNFFQFLNARHRRRTTSFSLERELAERHGGAAFTRMVFAFQLIVTVWGLSSQGAPTWEAGLSESPVEVNIRPFMTSTPAGGSDFNPPDQFVVQGDDFSIPQTAPPPSTPAGTIIPSQDRRNCIRDRAWIEFPENGMVIFDATTILGTANIENFAFYRFEIRSARPGENFAPIPADYAIPVPQANGVLGQITPYNFLPGEYRFRIVVFDTANEPKANCEITIHIQEPQPSPTPQFGS